MALVLMLVLVEAAAVSGASWYRCYRRYRLVMYRRPKTTRAALPKEAKRKSVLPYHRLGRFEGRYPAVGL